MNDVINCDVIIWYLLSILLANNMDICPLLTRQVSRRGINYIWSYAEITKIYDRFKGRLAPGWK